MQKLFLFKEMKPQLLKIEYVLAFTRVDSKDLQRNAVPLHYLCCRSRRDFCSWQSFVFVALHLRLVPGLAPSGRQRGSWGITENEVQQGEMREKWGKKSGRSTQLYRLASTQAQLCGWVFLHMQCKIKKPILLINHKSFLAVYRVPGEALTLSSLPLTAPQRTACLRGLWWRFLAKPRVLCRNGSVRDKQLSRVPGWSPLHCLTADTSLAEPWSARHVKDPCKHQPLFLSCCRTDGYCSATKPLSLFPTNHSQNPQNFKAVNFFLWHFGVGAQRTPVLTPNTVHAAATVHGPAEALSAPSQKHHWPQAVQGTTPMLLASPKLHFDIGKLLIVK